MIAIVAAKELVRDWRLWIGGLLMIAVATMVLSAVISQFETAATLSPADGDSLASMTQGTILFTVLAAVAVTGATTNLAISSGRRGYALLQLAGVLPRQVTVVVLIQLCLLALTGTGAGLILGRLTAGVFLSLAEQQASLQNLPVVFGAGTVAWTVGIALTLVILSGLRGAIRAGRVPAIEAVREPEEPRTRFAVMRWIGVGVATLATVILGINVIAAPLIARMVTDDPDGSMGIAGIVSGAQLFSIALTALIAALGPFIYPLILRAWTAIIPASCSPAWFLARTACRYRLTQSTAAVTPLMVGIALTGSLYTLFMTAGTTLEGGGTQNMTINHASIFTIIGPALLIAALGAAAVIFMTGRTRDRDNALIETGGGTLATTTLSAAFETIIYVGTAFLTGALVYGAVGLVATAALMQVSDTATPVYGLGISSLVAVAGLLVVGIATITPALTARRHTIPALLAH
ncbi:MAG: FtsX-like permease family protein [Microbacterium sp.]